MAPQVILTTDRLILRQITEADAPLIYALNSDPRVLQFLHEPALTDEADARRIIKEIILPQYSLYNLGRWAIIGKDDGQFMGWCGLKYIADEDDVDLGYRLMPQFWDKGYAREAAMNTLEFGFTQRNLASITGRAHIDNIASWRILEKIGMQFKQLDVENGETIKVYQKPRPVS